MRLSATALLRQCREERHRASGPGGQRRNKVETAIKLRHLPSGVSVKAEESRSLAENRRKALRRLRERIALEVRAPLNLKRPTLPAELERYLGDGGSLAINERNPDYPLVIAFALDALWAAQGSYAAAARGIGVTTSQLLGFLKADRELWRTVQESRQRRS